MLAGQHGLAQRGVLLVIVRSRLIGRVAVAGVQQAQVLGVLALEPRGDLGVGVQAGGNLRDGLEGSVVAVVPARCRSVCTEPSWPRSRSGKARPEVIPRMR